MLPLRKLVPEHSLSPGMVRVLSGVALFLSATSIAAAQQPPAGERGGRRGPPPEAFTACENLNVGDVCSVQTPDQTLTGTCNMDRSGERLLCVPEDRERRRQSGDRDGDQANAQMPGTGPGGPPLHLRTVTQSKGELDLIPATAQPIAPSRSEFTADGQWRIIKANSISIHKTGAFPNPGNPNTISEQNFDFHIPATPVKTDTATRVKIPGYALNGVSFDPGAGEFYMGDRSLGWQYNALSGAVELGLDANHAHVQPSGKYHYHGLPTGLLDRLDVTPGKHSPQIGWAVDGFPIYALYGFNEMNGGGGINEMQSSYRLKSGERPAGSGQPGGSYDGTFTADYEYVEGWGDLDECNGRMTVTPDFPNGTYAYFLTQAYPVVPRCVMGTPNRNASHH